MAPRAASAPPSGAGGFTLIELLVVMAIVALLLGLTAGGVGAALAAARQTKCASNLRMIAAAALAYADDHSGKFPWALRTVPGYTSWAWDFVVPVGGTPEPGVLWGYVKGPKEILQCPEFVGGAANWLDDPFTGYNYNVSFLGKVEGDPATRVAPARLSQVTDPSRTAFFGDGQFAGGANKFMRAPRNSHQHDFSGAAVREAGTQGFRHRRRTNVVFVDGHTASLRKSYLRNGRPGFVAPGSGFLSPDNSLYSLTK